MASQHAIHPGTMQAADRHGDHRSDHSEQNDHGDHGDGPHSTLSGYLTGFVLSVVLTAIPFWLVIAKVKPCTNASLFCLSR